MAATTRARRAATLAATVAGMIAGMAWGAGAAADDAPASTDGTVPVAIIDDVTITRSSIDVVIRRLHPASKPSTEQRMRIEASVLEQLVDEALLRRELARQLVEVADAEVQAAVQRLGGQLAARGTSMQAFLAESGRDERSISEQVRLEIALDKFVRSRMTPEAIDEFFKAKRRDFDGTRLRVSHILLRPDIIDTDAIARRMQQAEGIRRDILQGRTTFEDAARGQSSAPSRHRGGDIGWIEREGPLVDVFSRPVFALAKGEVSKPFVTPYGVHLAKVTDVESGRIGLDVVRPKLEKMLAAKLIRDLVTTARQATPVTYVPGVAYFDPQTPADGPEPRRIIVSGDPAGN